MIDQRLVEAARRHRRSVTKDIVAALEGHVAQPTRDKQEIVYMDSTPVCKVRIDDGV